MTTFYEKRGRRYRPVAEDRHWDSFPQGAHLVVCAPGSQITRYRIEPDHAGLLAAAEPLRDKIRETVAEKLHMRPTRPLLTMHQAAAWRKFQEAMGNDNYCVEYPSVGELADAVMDLIVRNAK
jgi:hypothetical protein